MDSACPNDHAPAADHTRSAQPRGLRSTKWAPGLGAPLRLAVEARRRHPPGRESLSRSWTCTSARTPARRLPAGPLPKLDHHPRPPHWVAQDDDLTALSKGPRLSPQSGEAVFTRLAPGIPSPAFIAVALRVRTPPRVDESRAGTAVTAHPPLSEVTVTAPSDLSATRCLLNQPRPYARRRAEYETAPYPSWSRVWSHSSVSA